MSNNLHKKVQLFYLTIALNCKKKKAEAYFMLQPKITIITSLYLLMTLLVLALRMIMMPL